jgi:hypothetical protein
MGQERILPHKVTKPIQLVAAWLVGLVLIDGCFLGTALYLSGSEWARIVLIMASIINVPLFLGAIFLLQTKFRAELQEDTFYSQYLAKKQIKSLL